MQIGHHVHGIKIPTKIQLLTNFTVRNKGFHENIGVSWHVLLALQNRHFLCNHDNSKYIILKYFSLCKRCDRYNVTFCCYHIKGGSMTSILWSRLGQPRWRLISAYLLQFCKFGAKIDYRWNELSRLWRESGTSAEYTSRIIHIYITKKMW